MIVGEALKNIEKRSHRFLQLQVLERALMDETEARDKLNAYLEKEGCLNEGGSILQTIKELRMEEFVRIEKQKEMVERLLIPDNLAKILLEEV